MACMLVVGVWFVANPWNRAWQQQSLCLVKLNEGISADVPHLRTCTPWKPAATQSFDAAANLDGRDRTSSFRQLRCAPY